MERAAEERVAVAVIRAWTEGHLERSLRIRVTRVADLESSDEETSVVATIDQACELVREWLETFVGVGARRGRR